MNLLVTELDRYIQHQRIDVTLVPTGRWVHLLAVLLLRLRMPPEGSPTDAEWGEHYFHITDPDGHELSIAKRLVR